MFRSPTISFTSVSRKLSAWALGQFESGYVSFDALGDVIMLFAKIPQMPSYHLKRADGNGITFVNIEVGRSTAKLPQTSLRFCVLMLG